MMKLVISLTAVCALCVGCKELTRDQEQGIKAGGAVVGTAFGIPPLVTDSIIGLGLIVSHYLAHKYGRSVEQNKAKA